MLSGGRRERRQHDTRGCSGAPIASRSLAIGCGPTRREGTEVASVPCTQLASGKHQASPGGSPTRRVAADDQPPTARPHRSRARRCAAAAPSAAAGYRRLPRAQRRRASARQAAPSRRHCLVMVDTENRMAPRIGAGRPQHLLPRQDAAALHRALGRGALLLLLRR